MTFRKVWLYSQIALLVFLALIVLIFMASNSERVTIKFLKWSLWQAPVFALIIGSASLGATLTLFSRTIIKLFKDIRSMRQSEQERKKVRQEVLDQINADKTKKEQSQ